MPSDAVPSLSSQSDGIGAVSTRQGGSVVTEQATPATSVFGAAKERAAAKALSAGPYFSAEERAEFFENKTPMWIVGARATESREYGPRVSFVVVLDPSHAPNGEFTAETSRTLDLGSSPFRESLAEELAAVLQTQKIIGPVYLAKHKTASGRDAWDLTEDEILY